MSTEQKDKLSELLRHAIEQDAELRNQYKIGDKFRFIRDRLQALQKYVEESLVTLKEEKPKSNELSEDEILVYVYLYNAQGMMIQTWQKMVSPNVLYDHSINRPIYNEKTHIDAFIRSKTNKAQHAYLAIAVKKQNLNTLETLKDPLGNPLVKVKEGALQFERLFSFTHNEHVYEVKTNGELVKKIV